MQFTSLAFVGFLVVVVAAYWNVAQRYRLWVLLAASYAFYSAWDIRFLTLIVASTLVDFTAAKRIRRSSDQTNRRRWLALSAGFNLSLLGLFKYFNFFIDGAADGLRFLGFGVSVPTLSLILPVGISFYTFQTMSYTIDVYRNRQEPTGDLLHFATYVAFFPQLVAGPIERAGDLLPQLKKPAALSLERFESAVSLIVRGLVLKIVVADSLAPFVDESFADPADSVLALVFANLAFALQIYGDFAGYSTIARGVASLLGIELSENFTEPYLSGSITEFWRRWHITLSAWFRDYLYIPLGGNRSGDRRTVINVVIVMAVAGLWHGAGWNFVLWGLYHGLWLAWERSRQRPLIEGVPRVQHVLQIGRTLVITYVGWLLFRVESIGDLGSLGARVVQGELGAPPSKDDVAAIVLSGLVVLYFDIGRRRKGAAGATHSAHRSVVHSGVLLGLSLVALLLVAQGSQTFIYSQF